MDTSRGTRCCAVVMLIVLGGTAAPRCWGDDQPIAGPDDHGQRLFERVFEPLPDAGGHSDGLGPLFNERSCIACHFLGGIGGAGPKTNNVELLTVDLSKNRRASSNRADRLLKLHPGFASDTSIVLHRFGTDDRYENFRRELLGLNRLAGRSALQKQASEPIKTIHGDVAAFWLAERNTTPLFGVGLIDSISDGEIVEAAASQSLEDPNVRGRFAGRFGWRGQSKRLSDFVRGASRDGARSASQHARSTNRSLAGIEISDLARSQRLERSRLR